MGVNPSKSGDFIHFPLTSSTIFACKLGYYILQSTLFYYKNLIINYIHFKYVIDMAKP